MSNSSIHIHYSTPWHKPQGTMSPVTFKHQVAEFASELNYCILLCKDVKINRNLGSTHENLDRLRGALESAESSIRAAYGAARKLRGIEMEIGDERSRIEMRAHISAVQSTIIGRLTQIANPSRSRSGSRRQHGYYEREKPAFRELLSQWNLIYEDASSTLLSLSRRIEATSTARTKPPQIVRCVSPPARHIYVSHVSPPSSPRLRDSSPSHHYAKAEKKDDITISLQDYDYMVWHLKNTWEEIIVGDEVQYVNCLYRKKKQWVRPADAFIRRCARQGGRLSRCTSFERKSPAMSGAQL
jgi:hypothetical protein